MVFPGIKNTLRNRKKIYTDYKMLIKNSNVIIIELNLYDSFIHHPYLYFHIFTETVKSFDTHGINSISFSQVLSAQKLRMRQS